MPISGPENGQASGGPRDAGRRRFARGGLAAPLVISSLASKPVLGAEVPYICTISGQMSGNTSVPRDLNFDCRTLGRSPGYWKTDKSEWPAPFDKGVLENGGQGQCKVPAAKTGGTAFNGVFGVELFWVADCKVFEAGEPRPANAPAATMLQVLMSGGGLNDSTVKALARAAVASLLNASSPIYGPSYPLVPSEVVRLFVGVYAGGLVPINATVSWNRDQVKNYFESLYGKL